MTSPKRKRPTQSAPWAHAVVRWAAGACVASVAGLGCAPDSGALGGVVETAHLRITNSTGNPICAGTSRLLETELERIAEALELPLWPEDEKLEVRFGQEAVAEVCTSWEPGSVAGCVGGNDDARVVAAIEVAYTASHELVHAVRLENGRWSTALFEEGVAELLEGSGGFPVYVRYPHGGADVGPLELLELSREEINQYYVSARSFVSWLWETEGRSRLMGLLNDPDFEGAAAAPSLFEQHFGMSLAEAEQAWRFDERPDPIWGTACIPERTYSLADGPVELSGDLDCGDTTAYGGAYFVALWPMCLEVPETTRVRISFEAAHGRFQVLGRESCDAGSAGAEAYRDKYMDAGDVLEQDIAGCRYRMLLSSSEPDYSPTPYAIRIEEVSR
jgi:hypothetical protein